ncbi:MAG: dienelactone hydrolase family protein, partial [Caldilinea sp.]
MRRFRKIVLSGLLAALSLVVLLVVFLAGSVAVDALAGGGRVAALTNTSISGPGGLTVAAYVARPSGEGPFPAVIMLHEF